MTTKKPSSKKTTKKAAPKKKAAAKKAPVKKKPAAKPVVKAVEETVVVPIEKTATVIYAADVKNPKTKRRFLDWFKF